MKEMIKFEIFEGELFDDSFETKRSVEKELEKYLEDVKDDLKLLNTQFTTVVSNGKIVHSILAQFEELD